MNNINTFKAGDWIIAEDVFAQIECITSLYYEPFDSETKTDVRVGDYKQTLIAYHEFCTQRGRILSGKAQIKDLECCYGIKQLSPADTRSLKQIISTKPEKLTEWKNKCKSAVDYITLYAQTDKGEAKNTLSKIRKAIKALPSTFSYATLQKTLQDIFTEKALTLSTECKGEDYISFALFYKLEEQKEKELTFFKVGALDYTDPAEDEAMLSTLITFEEVFLSMARITNWYNHNHPSKELTDFMETLHTTWHALFHHKWKECPLAKDFYDNAPKVNYTPDLAYATMQKFLSKNAQKLNIESFAKLIEDRDKEIVEMYYQQF